MREALKNITESRDLNIRLKNSFKATDWPVYGRVIDVVGHLLTAHLPNANKNDVVEIVIKKTEEVVLGEVVGFKDGRVLILPFADLNGIAPQALIRKKESLSEVPVGDFLLGHVIDPFLNPLSDLELDVPRKLKTFPLDRETPNPVHRKRIEKQLPLGVRAIDSLLTFGEGQRIGIMAGSGVGKSVLMGMIANGSSADVNVIGLIGERGREVREFCESELGPEGIKKSVVVVVTSDQSPLLRIRGAKLVTTIAEYFSKQGKNVLLMLDSITRVASAQREIGLAVGEPPTTKGYPPSVFTMLPKLLERAGPQKPGEGSISGIYTVLVDGDDFNDPLPDTVRGILDGHINLSRNLASKAHYPAIDVLTSASRVMYEITDKEHRDLASQIKELLAIFEENFDLIQMGGYVPGTNPKLDLAIKVEPYIRNFLRQDKSDKTSPEQTREAFNNLVHMELPGDSGKTKHG